MHMILYLNDNRNKCQKQVISVSFVVFFEHPRALYPERDKEQEHVNYCFYECLKEIVREEQC